MEISQHSRSTQSRPTQADSRGKRVAYNGRGLFARDIAGQNPDLLGLGVEI